MHVLEADIITIKINIDLMSLAQKMHFLQDVFQMTAIALVSETNHYHINELHLFWDTLYLNINNERLISNRIDLHRINVA